MKSVDYYEVALREIIDDLGLEAHEAAFCEAKQASELVDRIIDTYVQRRNATWWWDSLKVPFQTYECVDTCGYEHIEEFLPPDALRCWLLVEDESNRSWIVLDVQTRVVARILAESPPFEYYLVGIDLGWLICENHHGVLFLAGTAMPTPLE